LFTQQIILFTERGHLFVYLTFNQRQLKFVRLLVEWSKLSAMKVKNIQHMNEAVFILRHFIDLSARLLPLLYKLDIKDEPSPEEIRDKDRIIAVFNTYNFSTNTSKFLLESNILDLIKNCYQLITEENTTEAKREALTSFLNEYNRLKTNWRQVELN